MQVYCETQRLVRSAGSRWPMGQPGPPRRRPRRHALHHRRDADGREEIEKEILPAFLAYYERFEGTGLAAIQKPTGSSWGGSTSAARGSQPDEAELGYRLRKSAWGKDTPIEGSRALIRKGFTWSSACGEWSRRRQEPTSRRVMEKAGSTLVRPSTSPGPTRSRATTWGCRVRAEQGRLGAAGPRGALLGVTKPRGAYRCRRCLRIGEIDARKERLAALALRCRTRNSTRPSISRNGHPPPEEAVGTRRRVAAIAAGDGWVIDGNYKAPSGRSSGNARTRWCGWTRPGARSCAGSSGARSAAWPTGAEPWNGNMERWRNPFTRDEQESVIPGGPGTAYLVYRCSATLPRGARPQVRPVPRPDRSPPRADARLLPELRFGRRAAAPAAG